jgi:predicted small lipoprotein YifL
MRIRTLTLVATLALLAGCGGAGPGLTAPPSTLLPSTPAPSPTPDRSKPVGLIAMGHSGITGEGTGEQGMAVPEKSWATGTLPDVNSVYLRMVGVMPETEGHVANAGQGGASASRLAAMVEQALSAVPVPALAIIQTIDNDIQCDGKDAERITAFGESVREAIQLIVEASPNGHVLVVGQLGRPSATFLEALVAKVPSQRDALTGAGPCDFFNPSGELNQEHIANLTAIIDAFEAEQAKVCAEFTQCTTDGGVRAAYIDKLENFSSDWNHLNVRGQAAEAELIWPVVQKLLAS